MFKALSAYLEQQSGGLIAALGVAIVALVGVADYLTGLVFSFSLFYLLPISLAAWYGGRTWGIVIASISAVTWLAVNPDASMSHSGLLNSSWDAIEKLVLFLIIAYAFSALRRSSDREGELTKIDFLTGAISRQFFYDLVTNEINRNRRYRHPFTIINIDVDNFREINDRLGYDIGNSVLRSLAEALRRNVRAVDTLARYDVDEFALLLPETGYEPSQVVIRKVKAILADVVQQNEWPVTFSIGVVTYIRPPQSIDEIVRKSDDLMYILKKSGKNAFKHDVYDYTAMLTS